MNGRAFVKFAAKAFAANALPAELFRTDIDEATGQALFRRFVRVVEIENHNYCNRTCWFCPNAQIDRRSTVVLMADAVFEKIVSALEHIQYRQTLTWSRYHEAMAHPSFFDRIEHARRRLPDAHFIVVSNGDYLDRDRLTRLETARLNRLMLDLYLPDGQERNVDELRRALRLFEARSGLRCIEDGSPWRYVCEGSSIRVTMGVPQFSYEHGMSSRGGLVEVRELRAYRRRSVCFHPLHSVVIDYNGKGVLCCQVRSDAPQHAGAVIGDLTVPGYTLFDFYRDLGPARFDLLSPGPKSGPCATCNVGADGPDKAARHAWVAHMLNGVWPLNVVSGWAVDAIPFRGHLIGADERDDERLPF